MEIFEKVLKKEEGGSVLEITVRYEGGDQLLDEIKVVKPIEKRYGVRVELVSWKLEVEGSVSNLLWAYGYRKVGEEILRAVSIYAKYPWDYMRYKVVTGLDWLKWRILRIFWWVGVIDTQENMCFVWDDFFRIRRCR
uniref:Uncharacterized protein n=1 Tax=viral metagenome TaxID=1070528 RepID=A0A6M3J2U2_9ZZZZ